METSNLHGTGTDFQKGAELRSSVALETELD